jgi:nicotinamide riboside kinase
MARINVAILGAESTGKTTLARALVDQLQTEGKSAVMVAEYLLQWCDVHGRTPEAHEQAHIALLQTHGLHVAQSSAPEDSLIIADTSPLLTAVYSDVYFNDSSLYPQAVEQQRSYALTLLTGLDLASVADGIQRDSEALRRTVDLRLREVLENNAIAYATVYGQGPARTECALQAIAFKFAGPRKAVQSNWKWNCEKCSDADCEHRMFSRLTQ